MKKEEEEMLRKIRELRRDGKTLAEIAQELGKSINYVFQRLNKNYYPLKLRKLVRSG